MVDRFQRFLFYISEISRHWHKIAAGEMEQYGLKGPHAAYLTCIHRHPDGITAPRSPSFAARTNPTFPARWH